MANLGLNSEELDPELALYFQVCLNFGNLGAASLT